MYTSRPLLSLLYAAEVELLLFTPSWGKYVVQLLVERFDEGGWTALDTGTLRKHVSLSLLTISKPARVKHEGNTV